MRLFLTKRVFVKRLEEQCHLSRNLRIPNTLAVSLSCFLLQASESESRRARYWHSDTLSKKATQRSEQKKVAAQCFQQLVANLQTQWAIQNLPSENSGEQTFWAPTLPTKYYRTIRGRTVWPPTPREPQTRPQQPQGFKNYMRLKSLKGLEVFHNLKSIWFDTPGI